MQKPSGFIIKRPDEKRRTFQVLPYYREDGKKLYLNPVEHEALTAVNSQLAAGKLTADEARMHIKRVLIPKLKGDFGMAESLAVEARIGEHNLRLFNEYWRAVYRRKKIDAPETARSQFLHALLTLEPHSLHSTSIEVLQSHWDKQMSGTRHKRYGARINQLLKHAGRTTTLSLDRADAPQTIWITWEELNKILAYVNDSVLRSLYRMLWATGCRLGEAFAFSTEDLSSKNTLYVHRQVTSKLKIKPQTKNRKKHHTVVLPEGLPATQEWLALADKLTYRRRASHPLRAAARKAFPTSPNKWVSPHKLRHSFVHRLVEKGVSLHDIKNLIGDTLKTTEETYSGWIISDDNLDAVMEKLK